MKPIPWKGRASARPQSHLNQGLDSHQDKAAARAVPWVWKVFPFLLLYLLLIILGAPVTFSGGRGAPLPHSSA